MQRQGDATVDNQDRKLVLGACEAEADALLAGEQRSRWGSNPPRPLQAFQALTTSALSGPVGAQFLHQTSESTTGPN